MSDGIAEGEKDGHKRGYEMGQAKAFDVLNDVAHTIGYYEGYCHMIMLLKSDSKDSKIFRQCDKVFNHCQSISISTNNDSLLTDVQELKRLAINLKIPKKFVQLDAVIRSSTAAASDSLTF